MTQYDWLLVFLGIGMVIFFTYQRMARALFSLALVWLATLGAAVLYPQAAYRIQAVASKNPTLVRGLMFDGLFLVFFVAGYVLLKLSFPVTKIPKLGVLDYLMGLLLGIVITVIVVTLLLNSMGVMVREQWETNPQGWSSLRATFYRSQLRPYTSQVLAAYQWVFYPFFGNLPPVLVPQ
ncbi:MAG: CvpA family protein [Anaerolineae bacterium]